MNRFKVSILWLKATSICMAVFGFILALFNQSSLFQLIFNNHINPIFWNMATTPATALVFQKWIYGLLGVACIALGILLFGIIKHAYQKGEKWARDYILIAIIIWLIIDNIISFSYGVYFNILFNIIISLLYIIPILISWKEFEKA